MTARFIVADVYDGLATIPDGSVDLVVTSPPFLALRSYLPADHPDKGKEIGSEATPAEFIDPFAGSGTTLEVATGHGHDAVGIDIDGRNRDLAYQRIGPLMWTDEPA